jgi:hypothetical protein
MARRFELYSLCPLCALCVSVVSYQCDADSIYNSLADDVSLSPALLSFPARFLNLCSELDDQFAHGGLIHRL